MLFRTLDSCHIHAPLYSMLVGFGSFRIDLGRTLGPSYCSAKHADHSMLQCPFRETHPFFIFAHIPRAADALAVICESMAPLSLGDFREGIIMVTWMAWPERIFTFSSTYMIHHLVFHFHDSRKCNMFVGCIDAVATRPPSW